ncbi:hypothetical protein AB1Y20_023063 [Prymnesium parvum]|uniref:F-box domain-containing protein n=1 Tax=Prymnesium parvum TaxID=97485 RepID=A0AB34JF58_PRYPA
MAAIGLVDDVLLHVLLAFTAEPITTEWFPPKRPRTRAAAPTAVKLARALRFASVSRAWHAVAVEFLRTSPHRAVDGRDAPLRSVRLDRVQELVVRHATIPHIRSLTALSLHHHRAATDPAIAATLREVGEVSRLLSLAIPHSEELGPAALHEIAAGRACSSSLVSLNLRGLPSKAVPHLSLLGAVQTLRRLDLSNGSFAVDSVLRLLAKAGLRLTALALDGGLLEDSSVPLLGSVGELRELSLRDSRMSAHALAQLLLTLGELRQLELRGADSEPPMRQGGHLPFVRAL